MGEENQLNRPQITLTYAQSLDGSIAARRGEPLRISGQEALRMTHQLRARHDAILVGIGTVLADDPQLTVRLVEGENPQPVILDSRLRFPPGARLFGNNSRPWIVTGYNALVSQKASEDRRIMLESKGAKIFEVSLREDGRLHLPAVLEVLSGAGVSSLIVEGGASVITAFLRENLVDRLVITISPVLVGGLRAVETVLNDNGKFPRLDSVKIEPYGPDWVISGKLKR
jgi:GTP cyclohydrolase II